MPIDVQSKIVDFRRFCQASYGPSPYASGSGGTKFPPICTHFGSQTPEHFFKSRFYGGFFVFFDGFVETSDGLQDLASQD